MFPDELTRRLSRNLFFKVPDANSLCPSENHPGGALAFEVSEDFRRDLNRFRVS